MRLLSLPFLRPFRQLGLLAVRLGIGVVMALHGWTKWQQGPDGFLGGEWLGKLGIPMPEVLAWAVVVTELVGGVLIVLGLLTRIWSIGTVILLLVALTRVKGFDFLLTMGQDTVWDGAIDWVLLFSALGLAFAGPGKIALDYLLGIERD